MKKLKFILALAAAFVFSGCYETTLLARVPISALVSDKSADVKSTIVLTGITPQTHKTKTVTDNVRVFVPDAKFKDFPTGQSAYEMSVSVGSGEKGGKNSDKRAMRIYLDEFGGIYGRLSKNVLEQYAGAAKQGEAPTLKAAIKFENDTKDTYEMISGNDFKASDEAQTGGVYILAPGQVTGAIWAENIAIREALDGKAVKIGALRKAAK
jgi:putative lipoprotein